MKKTLIVFLALILVGTVTQEANAQRRGTKKRPAKEEPVEENETGSKREGSTRAYSEDDFGPNIWDKINIEIKPGNLFIGNSTSLSLKSNIGYNFNRTFSAGVGGKFFYFWQNFGNGSVSATDYGGFAYARAKITRELYLVGEYNYTRIGSFNLNPSSTIAYPTAGIGYMRPGIDWSSGFELLIVFDEVARNRLSTPIEYWINFSHNF